MKKIIKTILFVSLFFLGNVSVAFALPTARYEENVFPFVTNFYDLGATTNFWNHIYARYASTTAINIGTLNGPLQANNGFVSATTSIGVLYGGTGLTSIASSTILVGNAQGGFTAYSTTTLGIAGSNYFTLTGNNLQNNSGNGLGLNVTPTFATLEVQASSTTANAFAVWNSVGGSLFTVIANGNTGIGTTSPGQKLAVGGDILGNNIIGSYFTATTSTASTFPYASTTVFSATGNAYFGTTAGEVMIATTTATPGVAMDYFGGYIRSDRSAAANDTRTISYRIFSGRDATLGPLLFDIGTNPSATGANRFVYFSAGDNVAFRNFSFAPDGGFFGIGTTSPQSALHVNTNSTANLPPARFSNQSIGPTYNGYLTENNNTGAPAAARNWFVGANSVVYGDFNIKTSNAQGGSPITAGTSRIYVDPTGNVGLGSTTPEKALSVMINNATPVIIDRSGSGNANTLQFRNTDGSIFIGLNAAEGFAAGLSQDLTIAPFFTFLKTGQLGLGTQNPFSYAQATIATSTTGTWTLMNLLNSSAQVGDGINLDFTISGITPTAARANGARIQVTRTGANSVADFSVSLNDTTGTDTKILTLQGSTTNAGVGTTTPLAKIDSYTTASTTSMLLEAVSGKGGCLIMQDVGAAPTTYTQIYAKAGVLFSKVATSLSTCN